MRIEEMNKFYDTNHEINFYLMLSKLDFGEHGVECFCYMASTINRPELMSVLDCGYINHEVLEEVASAWTLSERAAIDLAWQMYSHTNLFYQNEEPEYGTVHELFSHMQPHLIEVALTLLTQRYKFPC